MSSVDWGGMTGLFAMSCVTRSKHRRAKIGKISLIKGYVESWYYLWFVWGSDDMECFHLPEGHVFNEKFWCPEGNCRTRSWIVARSLISVYLVGEVGIWVM